MLAQVADVIELVGLQVGSCHADLGEGSLGKNVGSNILNGGIGDLMDEADVLVFARHDPRDDLTPSDFGVDDGLADRGGRNRSSRQNIACW